MRACSDAINSRLRSAPLAASRRSAVDQFVLGVFSLDSRDPFLHRPGHELRPIVGRMWLECQHEEEVGQSVDHIDRRARACRAWLACGALYVRSDALRAAALCVRYVAVLSNA